MKRARREGVALLLTLLGILVMEMVVAGAFHAALQQRRVATAQLRITALEAAARAALATTISQWSARDTVQVGATLSLAVPSADPATVTTATLQRVRSDLYLLTATARQEATGAQRSVAALLRELAPAELVRSFSAVAVARSAEVAGAVDGVAPAACMAPAGAPHHLPALLLLDSLPASTRASRFGTFASVDLLSTQDTAGLRISRGRHRLEGAHGPGVLVVDGSLTIAAGASFAGLLIVRDSLRIEGGASVSGAVQLMGHLDLLTGARVRYDPCALVEAFRQVPALRGPVRAARHWWIPAA